MLLKLILIVIGIRAYVAFEGSDWWEVDVIGIVQLFFDFYFFLAVFSAYHSYISAVLQSAVTPLNLNPAMKI